jgi:hypothetical protein
MIMMLIQLRLGDQLDHACCPSHWQAARAGPGGGITERRRRPRQQQQHQQRRLLLAMALPLASCFGHMPVGIRLTDFLCSPIFFFLEVRVGPGRDVIKQIDHLGKRRPKQRENSVITLYTTTTNNEN